MNTIRSLQLMQYGGPETIRIADLPAPVAGPAQVLVRVHAAGVNALDWKLREGYVKDAFPLPLPAVLGIELAGVVEQVGSDELIRENDPAQRQMFKLKKFTIGYFHDVKTHGPLKFDAGVFASRHLLPSSAASYGNDPTSYMLFIRFKLQ